MMGILREVLRYFARHRRNGGHDEGYQKGDAPRMVLVEYNNELLVYQALIEW